MTTPQNINSSSGLSWLHLTDLHVGMANQDWLWPRLKQLLYDDLSEIHSVTGDIDLVIFSGDLTQRGTRAEFDQLDDILSDLWKHFRSIGFTPQLLTVPGNHDVQRPNELSATHHMLKLWWKAPAAQKSFFSNPNNEYFLAAKETLREYSAWQLRAQTTHNSAKPTAVGLLPGDQSFRIPTASGNIGVACLNSTWLQLDGDDYTGQLHIDTKQLLAITGNNPDAWCKENVINFLVSHHPTNWLHEESAKHWHNEIFTAGRFDAHLYGHMHETLSTSFAFGGGPIRVTLQGASTCGLQYHKTGLKRLHGYSVGRSSAFPNRMLRIWPRRLHHLAGGGTSFGPDVSIKLDAIGSYQIPLSTNSATPAEADESNEPSSPESEDVTLDTPQSELASLEILSSISLPPIPSAAHTHVRQIEQRKLTENLAEARSVWISAEWGMGIDGFIASVRQTSFSRKPVYRLDLDEYPTKESFFEGVRTTLGCSFDRLCQILANAGDSTLILDNVQINSPIESEIEGIVPIMLDFCVGLKILICSAHAPIFATHPVIRLSALDEADLRTYVANHELGGQDYTETTSIHRIYRHTDGIPSRIDQALKELQVVSLSELENSDSDVEGTKGRGEIPKTLRDTVKQLSSSTDDATARSFSLLKALTFFPHGEALSRVKHFNSIKPFRSEHANSLHDQGLIEATNVHRIDKAKDGTASKILVVPRTVRDCVRELLIEDEAVSLNRRAAEIYFGQEWTAGIYKPPTTYKFDRPIENYSDILNANTIIIRLIKENSIEENIEPLKRTLGLTVSYLSALSKGGHYRSIASFCEEILLIVPPGDFDDKIANIKHQYARALRMSGEYDRAKKTIEEVRNFDFIEETKQSLLVNLALIHDSLGEKDDAISVAKEVIKLNRHSSQGLHARGLLIQLKDDDPRKDERLKNHEAFCRRNGATSVANNIAINRAKRAGKDATAVREILAPVMKGKGGVDYYNRNRAAIELAEHSLQEGNQLNAGELAYLIIAYHYVYNEQFTNLFDRCHDALWRILNHLNDTEGLLSLFRNSSLHWRLRDQTKKEDTYLDRLAGVIGDKISRKLSNLSRDAAYYLVRASSRKMISGKTA